MCENHYKNTTIYSDDFKRIKVVSLISDIPQNDFLSIFNYIEERSKSPLLKSFQDMTISDIDCHQLTGLTKTQFEDLVSKFENMRNTEISVREVVALFLCRLRTAISYPTLKTLFNLKNDDSARHYCDRVQKSFEKFIIPKYIGINHTTREFLLTRQSPIAKAIFSTSNLILIADGTYVYHQKSANNFCQRKSFSMQKLTHLCKPFTLCTSDGYIIDFFGPYNADSNDAKIFNDILHNETELISMLEAGDVFVLDRGFRDILPYIKKQNYIPYMPSFMPKNEKQLSCRDANYSRTVTQVRWVVEAVHRIVKKKWKILSVDFQNQSLVKVKPYFQIAGALHNMYGKPLQIETDFANKIIPHLISNYSNENSLYEYCTEKNYFNKRFKYQNIQEADFPDFPQLEDEHLKLFSLGSYQLGMAVSYIAELFNFGTCNMYVFKVENNLLAAKIFSRHKKSKEYRIFFGMKYKILKLNP